jgi:hypothetical protein
MNVERVITQVFVILGSALFTFMAHFVGEHFTNPPTPSSRIGRIWGYTLGGIKAAGFSMFFAFISIVSNVAERYTLALLISAFIMGMLGVSNKYRQLSKESSEKVCLTGDNQC